MDNIRRSIIAGALALPLSLGAFAGAAGAAEFSEQETQVTEQGVMTNSVHASSDG